MTNEIQDIFFSESNVEILTRINMTQTQKQSIAEIALKLVEEITEFIVEIPEGNKETLTREIIDIYLVSISMLTKLGVTDYDTFYKENRLDTINSLLNNPEDNPVAIIIEIVRNISQYSLIANKTAGCVYRTLEKTPESYIIQEIRKIDILFIIILRSIHGGNISMGIVKQAIEEKISKLQIIYN